VDNGSPAASAGSAASSRSSVRHRPNGIPVPVKNPLASVLALAPTSRPHTTWQRTP